MLTTNAIGVLFALTSAAVWGGVDFSGGLATRKSNQYQVLTVVSLTGMVLLMVCVLLWGEGLPPGTSTMWGAMAGGAGALGGAALYRALSLGHTGSVAATAA